MRKVFSLLAISAIMAGFTLVSWFLYGIFAGMPPAGAPLLSDIIPGGIAHSQTAECIVAVALFAILYVWGNLPFVEKYDDGDSYLVTPAVVSWFGIIVSVAGSFLWYHAGILDLTILGIVGMIILMLVATALNPLSRRFILMGTYFLYFAVGAIIMHGAFAGWVFLGAFALLVLVVWGIVSAKQDLARIESQINPRSL